MITTAPHYLLFTQANDQPGFHRSGGRWKFVLEEIGSDFRIEEADDEPNVRGERLQLLAVIRGLEALAQPSSVTLITPSRYVGRGIRSGLQQWRRRDWKWERGDQLETIPHLRYWQRVDAAMAIHQISCRVWQFDAPHTRTQGNLEERPRRTTPFVSSFADAGQPPMTYDDSPRPNRIRISEDLRRSYFDPEAGGGTAQLVHARVKPVGQGRAYGYAIN